MGQNLKEVRNRISAVISTQQITKAMKMVAAAKLKKAQDAITQMRPYAEKLHELLVNVLSSTEGDIASTFNDEREVKRVLVVVVTSNKGLCGAFNANIIKKATQLIKDKYSDQLQSKAIVTACIGKKGFDFFRKNYPQLKHVSDHVNLFDDLSFDNVTLLTNKLMKRFDLGIYDSIEVVYGRFKNAAIQTPIATQLLPVAMDDTPLEGNVKADYIFEPEKSKLLEELIPGILRVQFQSYLLDTNASEQGARMTAMEMATENANDLLKELRLSYNKARQESITGELLEIVSGAQALEG